MVFFFSCSHSISWQPQQIASVVHIREGVLTETMGKNRKRGSKNSQRGKEVPSFVEFLEQCFDEARAQHQRELGYIEDVIIQKYCERMREVLPNSSTEDIQAVATAPSSECFIALKRDLGGVC